MKNPDRSDAAGKGREPLAIEQLLSPDQLRTNDEAMADPIRDRLPQAAPKRKVRGVLAALDQLDQEATNRRFKP